MTYTAAANSPAPDSVSSSPRPARAWLIWGAACTFYLFAYYVRVSPAVMTRDLMAAFQINAGQLGTLSATYFYAYVLMQIPTGILVDSWGARKLLVVGALSAAAGTFVFGTTGHFVVACLARGVVGGATAVAWVVTLKLVTHWFPARRFALLSGLSLFVGNLGALMAQIPLRYLVQRLGWRAVTLDCGFALVVMALIALLLVRNDPVEIGRRSFAPPALQHRSQASALSIGRGLGELFRFRNTWLICIAQGGLLGPVLAFTGLWGPAYLSARYGIGPGQAAAVDSVMLVCFAIASPLMGYASDRIGRRKPLYVGGAAVAAIGWAILLYWPGLSLAAFTTIAGITSFAAAAIILGFALGKESVPEQYLGTISGLINLSNQLGPMVLQPAIGWLLDLEWDGTWSAGVRVYGHAAFQTAFALMLAWSVLSVFMLAALRETHCRQGGAIA